MNIAKSIQLTTAPLEELMAKGESIDFRLDEAAWQDLGVGDHVEFWEDFTGWQKEPTDKSRREPGVLAKWKEEGVLVNESSTTPGLIKRAPYAIHEEWLSHDLLLNADKLTMPVFLLTGADDGSCPPEHVQQLFDAIPHENKVFEIIEGAPHTYRTEADLREVKERLSKWLANQ